MIKLFQPLAEKIILTLIRKIDELSNSHQKPTILTGEKSKSGISVIIPERDSPQLLENNLPALINSLKKCHTKYEIIIIANASHPNDYKHLTKTYKTIQWYFFEKAFGFAQAIKVGLEKANYSWVYLLNNDMRLTPTTLSELWKWRSNSIFALASQIFFEDESKRREETGYTGFNSKNGMYGLYDRLPDHDSWVAQHLYAGGGATLFNRQYLTTFIRESFVYRPFYWEDVEWGIRAQQAGLEVLFVPKSQVYHLHRATVSRFYTKQQITHMFNKNGLECCLRNKLTNNTLKEISLLKKYGLLTVKNFYNILTSRYKSSTSFIKPNYFGKDVLSFYPTNPKRQNKPWIVWVTPFAISPISHGGARRIIELTKQLSSFYRIALISDEGWVYSIKGNHDLNHFSRIDLIIPNRIETKNSRIGRIKSHSRINISQQLTVVVNKLNPIAVQIEYEELCQLIPNKKTNWYLTLHDVNHDGSEADNWVNKQLIKYENIICCSEEDQNLLKTNNTLIIKNGTAIPKISSYRQSKGGNLLFIGPLRYQANLDGIIYFIKKTFPALKKKINNLSLTLLTGHNGLEIAQKHHLLFQDGIELVEHTDNVNDYIKKATLTINPLLAIRGSSIKTIESLAQGRICVSSHAAARGLMTLQLSGLRIVESEHQWIEDLTELIKNDTLRHKLESPTTNILTNYDWKYLAYKYRELYEDKIMAL